MDLWSRRQLILLLILCMTSFAFLLLLLARQKRLQILHSLNLSLDHLNLTLSSLESANRQLLKDIHAMTDEIVRQSSSGKILDTSVATQEATDGG